MPVIGINEIAEKKAEDPAKEAACLENTELKEITFIRESFRDEDGIEHIRVYKSYPDDEAGEQWEMENISGGPAALELDIPEV